MTNKEAIEAIKCNYPPRNYTILREALDKAMDLLRDTEWIPFTFDEDGNLDCPIPYEGQDILISYGDSIAIDTMHYDDGWDFENYLEISDIDAWMPLPKSYKEGANDD